MKNKNGFSLVTVIVIICISSIISAITSGVIVNNSYRTSSGINYNKFVSDEDLNGFLDVYETILNNYYESIDKKAMINTAINAMLNYVGDPYTTYMTTEEKEDLAERLEGTYKGIGIAINGTKIETVTPNSPAEKAGLLAGDFLLAVDNEDVTEYDSKTIASLIKNTNKKNVTIKVLRGEEEKEFTIDLKELILTAETHKVVEGTSIGYIYLSIFSNNIAEQFTTAYEDLQNQGIDRLIIDVRDNAGGYLDGAEKIASKILTKDKLIYSLQSKDSKKDYYDQTEEAFSIPIVVLINENSASASEILAAALKDSYGATLIGTRSFGKGKVQQTYTLDDGSMAKYTSAKWLRPNGECIDSVGILPDILVELELGENQEVITDTQYNKAVEYLNAL